MKLKYICIVTALAACSLSEGVLFHDDFNGALSSEWTINNDAAGYYSLSPSGLSLRCNDGDLYESANDYQNLFLINNPASGDFTMTLKTQWIVPPTTNWWAQITLVAYDDDDNHTRVGNVRFKNRMALESLTEEGAVHTDLSYSTKDFGATPFWLQMRKEGTLFTAWSSTDGHNYTQAHSAVSYSNSNPDKLGFIAMADPTETSTVFIDAFIVIPEPSTASLLSLVAAVGLVLKRRRQ
jgi:hypothetical protein